MATSLSKSQLQLLAERLTSLREKRGMSAAEVARQALGYANGSHVAVSRLERAVVATPRAEHLRKLAAFYHVSPDHLMANPSGRSTGSAATSERSHTGVAARFNNRRPASQAPKAPQPQSPAEELRDYWLNWTPGSAAVRLPADRRRKR